MDFGIKKIKNKDLVFKFGQMEQNIKVDGNKIRLEGKED